jgi:hypothetical protein
MTPEQAAVYALGGRLRQVLATPAAYALLDEGTWTSGACWPLARAVARWLGPAATLCTLTGTPHLLSTTRGPQHVVVTCAGLCLDGDGASTAAELVRRWAEIEGVGDPRLEPYDEHAVRASGCSEGAELDDALARLLADTLGPSPASWHVDPTPPMSRPCAILEP